MGMKGYKVFNSDWTCQDFQYEVGKTYEMDEEPIICKRGFHFCQKLKDCFYFYPFNKDLIKIAEVEALGEMDEDLCDVATKYCTNKIKIIREIRFEDLITETQLVNTKLSSHRRLNRDRLPSVRSNYPVIVNGDIVLDGEITVLRLIKMEEEVKMEFHYFDEIIFPPGLLPNYYYDIEYTALKDVKEESRHEL
jgi:hypothetical protein